MTVLKMTLPAGVLKKVSSLTSNNNHSESYRTAAHALKLTELANQFARIGRDHERAGYLTDDLNRERNGAYDQLLAHARRLLSPEQFQQLRSSL